MIAIGLGDSAEITAQAILNVDLNKAISADKCEFSVPMS